MQKTQNKNTCAEKGGGETGSMYLADLVLLGGGRLLR